MAKTIILKIGPKLAEMELNHMGQGSAIRAISDNAEDKKQVSKTRIIGRTPDGRVLRHTVRETNRG